MTTSLTEEVTVFGPSICSQIYQAECPLLADLRGTDRGTTGRFGVAIGARCSSWPGIPGHQINTDQAPRGPTVPRLPLVPSPKASRWLTSDRVLLLMLRTAV
jgi:hypothetical protein